MEKLTGNEPAFPVLAFDKSGEESYVRGITIRQHYAGLFMQGLIASWGQHDVTDFGDLANDAVLAADALINELNEVTTNGRYRGR